jgi:hypothetical protein
LLATGLSIGGSRLFYGAYRYYKNATFQNVEDESVGLPPSVVRQILEASGFASTGQFNSEMSRHCRGQLPPALQERLRRVLDGGHGWVPAPPIIVPSVTNGAGEPVDMPLGLAEMPSPCSIEIFGASFEEHGSECQFCISAEISSPKLFAPRRGSERLCQLLIDDEFADFRGLPRADQDLVMSWLGVAGPERRDFRAEFEEARREIVSVVEKIGLMSATFRDESGREMDYFLSSEDERIGFA